MYLPSYQAVTNLFSVSDKYLNHHWDNTIASGFSTTSTEVLQHFYQECIYRDRRTVVSGWEGLGWTDGEENTNRLTIFG